ncbi:MAG: twin-arginine translocase subunit TatC [Gemmataceae bacterium]|nr:twin-arginine translocase subunit TatC [Gemmataceae bacterium]
MKTDDYADPDDMFADTRMTFGEHIEDLRTHLMRAIKGFVLCMVVCLFAAGHILTFITAPVDRELKGYYERYYAQRIEKLRNEFQQNEIKGLPNARQVVWLKPRDREIAPKAPDPKAVLPNLVPRLIEWLNEMNLDVDPKIVGKEGWQEFDMVMPDPIAFAKLIQDSQLMTNPPSLKSLSIQEPFVVYFKIAIMAGFVLSSPWVFYQVWAFVAAGLYPHEKRLVNVYLPVSLLLFLTGCAVCQFLVIPKAVQALLWFNELMGVQPDLRLNEWLGFAIFMPVVFGISFQTPLVMLFLFMIGLFDIEAYKEKRRMAYFAMAVFAALITPSTDAFSMMFMWVPMCLLYEFGIWLCWYRGRQEDDTADLEEEHELVGV